MKVLVADRVGQEGLDMLTSKGHDVVFLPEIDPQELVEKVKDVDALIVRGRTKVTKDIVSAAQKLKVIARSGTGVDNIDLYAAKEKNIIVVNAPGANSESVAEHTFALILALTRSLVPTAITLKSGTWSKSDFRGMELKGKTLGVIGLGHIGKRVAELGSAFGMDIVVYTRSTPKFGKQVSLSDLLSTSDIVSIHVPLTDETRSLIGAKELSLMKKHAYLVNTARGPVVDEAALIEALKKNIIAGAALDVFTKEPLAANNELLKLPNVIATPHVAADSKEAENRASRMIAEDIETILSGGQAARPVTI